ERCGWATRGPRDPGMTREPDPMPTATEPNDVAVAEDAEDAKEPAALHRPEQIGAPPDLDAAMSGSPVGDSPLDPLALGEELRPGSSSYLAGPEEAAVNRAASAVQRERRTRQARWKGLWRRVTHRPPRTSPSK